MSDATKNDNGTSQVTPEEKGATPAPAAKPTPAPAATPAATAAAKPKSMMPVIIAVVIAAVVIVIAAIVGVTMTGSGFYDNAAQTGQAPYKTDEEKQEALNRVVEEGMLNISIASLIEFQNGTSEGTAYIENVPANKYVMKVTIRLDSNDEVVYESGGIKPDTYINSIKLSKNLPAGTYPATATFTAYQPDSLEEVGQAAAKITIVVDQ